MFNRIVDIVLIVNIMCFCVHISIVRFGFWISGLTVCSTVFATEGRF